MASSGGGSSDPRGRAQALEGVGRPLPPPWAHPPPQVEQDVDVVANDDDSGGGAPTTTTTPTTTILPPWRLLEIKDGVQVAEHDLNHWLVTVLGRAEGAVDVLLWHASVSRFHARIAFDSAGTAWLRDYGSSHGTFVNKKRIPVEACGKDESMSTARGSRGVVIRPGDVVQLGASTRLLLLEGPSPDQVQELVLARRRRRDDLQRSSQALPPSAATASAETDHGGENDSDPEECGSPADVLSMSEDAIPPAHRKLFEKIRALQHKVENLATEVERIQRKGDAGLSAGQEKQVHRNEERIAQLQSELESRCQELWQHLRSQRDSTIDRRRSAKNADHNHEEDDDDDEVAGRTSSFLEFDEQGETEASLLRKYEMLVERSRQGEKDLHHEEERVRAGKDKVARLNALGNFDDAFYATNDLELEQERLEKVKRDQGAIASTLKDVMKMLKIVKPTWKDEEEERNGKGDANTTSTSMLPPPMQPPRAGGNQRPVASPSEVRSQTASSADFVMPMPPRAAPGASNDRLGEHEEVRAPLPPMDSPSSKRRRVLGPALPSPTSSNPDKHSASDGALPSGDAASQDLASPRSKPVAKPRPKNAGVPPSSVSGTLAFLTGASHVEPPSREARRIGAQVKPAPEPSDLPARPDPQQDVWQPPKDQDGSGKTKLNAKFAGRY